MLRWNSAARLRSSVHQSRLVSTLLRVPTTHNNSAAKAVPAASDGFAAAEAAWFASQHGSLSEDARTARLLRMAKEHGSSEMTDCINKQIQFSALPTTMIGSCCLAALFGLDLSSGPHAAAHLLVNQAVVGLLGASASASLFYLVHANTLYAGLQYSGHGVRTLEFVRRHGWRFNTLVMSQVATQAFAACGLILYLWLPVLSASHQLLPLTAGHYIAPGLLSSAAAVGFVKQARLFRSLSVVSAPRPEMATTRAASGDPPEGASAACDVMHLASIDGVPKPGAFSRATVHNGLVYVSGTGAGNDTADGTVPEASAFDETLGALENVATILRAAGSSPERIVVATMLLSNKDDYAECNRAYVQFFADRGVGAERLPARSSALWAVPTCAKVAFSAVATVDRAELGGAELPEA